MPPSHALILVALLLAATTTGRAADTAFTVQPAQVRWSDTLVAIGQAACDTGPMPLSLMREAYFARQRTMQCMDAVLALNALDKDADASPEEQAAANDDYRHSCLVTFASVTDLKGGYSGNRATSHHLLDITSPEQVDRLSRSIGTLSSDLDDHYCSATLVDFGDGATTLVTALHCIGEVLEQGDGTALLATVRPEIRFSTVSGDVMSLQLPTSIAGRQITYPEGDVVALSLPAPPEPVIAATPPPPAMWEPLLVVGTNPFLNGWKESTETLSRALADIVAVSIEPNCVSFGLTANGRLFHNCQTDRSQSGSAILTVRDGQFVFSGVHTKRESQAEYPCGSDMRSYNSGLAIGPAATN